MSVKSGWVMMELPEEIIVERYMNLVPPKRTPKAFWTIAVAVLPLLRTEKRPPVSSWPEVRSFLLAPWHYGVDILAQGTHPDAMTIRDAAKVALIAMSLVEERSGRIKSDQVERNDRVPTPGFCAYCWRLGTPPPRKTGFQPAKRVKGDIASDVRCWVHRTPKAQAAIERWLTLMSDQSPTIPNESERSSHDDFGCNPTAIRQGRARENDLEERERELLKADRVKHAADPQNRFEMKLASIVDAEDRSEWPQFVQSNFPFAAYDERFAGLCESPERALAVLDDEMNIYPGRQEFHAALIADRFSLGIYLLPMILRADVWVEFDEQTRLEKAHMARMRRLGQPGRSDAEACFKMPSREEWFLSKQGDG